MAGPLGVSHMMLFNQTNAGTNLRILRCPRGPTVTFRVNKYALASDVIRSSRRPVAPGAEYNTAPMLVLNNFGGDEKHVRLLVTVFQNLFPPLHVHTMRLSQARRIVLLSYNAETKTIDWRHYLISVRPVGVSRAVRRIVEGTTRSSSASSGSITGRGADGSRRGRALVNLANDADIADYVMRGSSGGGEDTDTSEAESEAEDMADPANAVELSQKYLGRGNAANSQRAVRLREVGPRMELRLVKIEEGLNGSEVLYHDYVQKSPAEVAERTRAEAEKRKLVEQRRQEQERNVQRKKQDKGERKVAFGGEQVAGDESPAGDEEEDDEFAYEDQFGPGSEAPGADDAAPAAPEDEVLFDEGEGEDEESDAAEEGDAAGEDEDEEDEEEDSDLEPIPLGEVEHDIVEPAHGKRSRRT